MTNFYAIILMAFGVCFLSVAVMASVEAYNRRRSQRMSFVRLHKIRMRKLK